MKEECLICKAPLEYLTQDELMECAICHKQERSKTRCVEGHYVCSECHTQGMDSILGLCLSETSRDPIGILEKMMSMPFCHMHGPEHHVMVGAALLTAYKKQGEKLICRKPCRRCTVAAMLCRVESADFGAPAVQESARDSLSPSLPAPHRWRWNPGA